MSVVPSCEIWHRGDFPYLCMWRRLYRVAEIGVDRGEFAQMFLDRWIGDEYWGVDNYAPYPELDFPRHADYDIMVNRLARHGGRFKLIPLDSVKAADHFKDGSLDFVYIDGSHDYDSVRDDLRAWFPKISPGGIIAGHDFDDHQLHEGVRRAVVEFGRKIGRTIYLTAVPGFVQEQCPSWYCYRDGIPGPGWRRC